ncbi:MAG: hypothetical protein WAN34_11720 [Acidimicrobiia bacterium]
MTETHDLENTVVAVLDHPSETADIGLELAAAGYQYEILSGEDGRRRLDPGGQESLQATIKRIIDLFGDQYRVLEQLDTALAEDSLVVSVDTTPDEATDAVSILRDHGGRYIWKFGEWTFTKIED